jgi:ADP-ribose pyrophosphatase YjhB (NUDIX family)
MASYVETIRRKINHDMLMLSGVNVIIYNEKKAYLLQQRATGNWGLLGGLMELGESLEEAAVREVFEESRLVVSELSQIHTFSGKAFHFKLPNQDEIYVVTTLFLASQVSGDMSFQETDETLDLKYFTYEDLPATLEPEYRQYIQYFEDHVLS